MLTLAILLVLQPAAAPPPPVNEVLSDLVMIENPDTYLPPWNRASADIYITRGRATWDAYVASEPEAMLAADDYVLVVCGRMLESAIGLMASEEYLVSAHGLTLGRQALAVCRAL